MTTTALARVRLVRRRVSRRRSYVFAALLVALVGAWTARVLAGDYVITVPDFVRIVGGADIPGASFILMEAKLPRAVAGLLAGAAFGLGGAIFQTVLRNPLASPDLLGISGGASLGAVLAIVVFSLTGGSVPLLAVGCALLTGVVIVACARGVGQMVLVGVALTAALVSVVQYLFARATIWEAQAALVWMTGSLNQVEWSDIRRFALVLAVLVVAVISLAPALRVLELGPDLAAGFGVSQRRSYLLLGVAVLLVSTATAVTGPIAFVALLSGPIARRLLGGRATLAGAALVGAVVVVAADYVAAYGVPDTNLPVGVVTGVLGAPFLLWLIIRRTSNGGAS